MYVENEANYSNICHENGKEGYLRSSNRMDSEKERTQYKIKGFQINQYTKKNCSFLQK